MTENPALNPAEAHRYFSAFCFNQAWDYMDRQNRSPDEDELMRMLAHAAIWHWLQRPDCTEKNLSIGYWQLSRVYALLSHPEDADAYARRSLASAEKGGLDPFYFGYAYEALARAARLKGDLEAASQFASMARNYADQVEDPENRRLLSADIDL